MKLLFEFLPIFLFFVTFKLYGIFVATGVAIAVTLVQVAFQWYQHRHVGFSQIVILVLMVVLGGATLFLQDEMFIKWKPTVLNWLFAVAFFGSQFIGEKTLVERFMGATVTVPKAIWQRLNVAWAGFFLFLGSLNLFVIYHFDTETWVNFKLFGIMGLMILFILLQAYYLSHYIEATPDQK